MLELRKSIAREYHMLWKKISSQLAALETVLVVREQKLQENVIKLSLSTVCCPYFMCTICIGQINVGDAPTLTVSDRKWNDDSIATTLQLSLPPEVSKVKN